MQQAFHFYWHACNACNASAFAPPLLGIVLLRKLESIMFRCPKVAAHGWAYGQLMKERERQGWFPTCQSQSPSILTDSKVQCTALHIFPGGIERF